MDEREVGAAAPLSIAMGPAFGSIKGGNVIAGQTISGGTVNNNMVNNFYGGKVLYVDIILR